MTRSLERMFVRRVALACLLAAICLPGPLFGEMMIRMKRPAVENAGRGKAMWVVRHTLLSRESIDRMLSRALEGGFNTLFVQVCGRGDSYFPSRVFPPAEDYLQRVGDSYDPLDYVLKKAHAAGISVHVWTNALLVWSAPRPPRDSSHVVNARPEWTMVDNRGERMVDYPFERFAKLRTEGVYRSLAEPESSRELELFLLDLVSRYPVDGLHLDYIRYPFGTADFPQRVRREFAASHGRDPVELLNRRRDLESEIGAEGYESLHGKWLDYRAGLITGFVRRLNGHLRQIKPEVRLSAAVKPDISSAYRVYGQDWPRWVREGQMDFVVLMSYSTNAELVYSQIESACRAVGPERVWAGLRAWEVQVAGVIERLKRVEPLVPGGVSFFSYNGMENNAAFFSRVKREMAGW